METEDGGELPYLVKTEDNAGEALSVGKQILVGAQKMIRT
jgi:hypothetical protein